MPAFVSRPIYGLEPIIALVALAVATADAVVVPLVLLLNVVPTDVLSKLAIASCLVLAVIFTRLLFWPAFYYAMQRANSEMQGDQPFRFRLMKFSDPEWGLTGRKWGRGYLVPLRLILMAEFLVVIFLARHDPPWVVITAFSGIALAILLTQSQLTDHFRRPAK